ncbi:glutathione S-transferase T3-like protein [Tanacetum coccineum]
MDNRGRDHVVSSVVRRVGKQHHRKRYKEQGILVKAEYDQYFSLESCWQILKDHSAWKQVEMPSFYSKQNPGSKKVKTSETTSGLVQGGLNLNEEEDGSGKEVREVRPIGRDRAKKKASSSSRSEASSGAGGGLVDMVADKWKSLKSVSWGKKEGTTTVRYRLEESGIGYP